MKDVAKFAGGLVLTVLLLWWVLRGVDLGAVRDSWDRVSLAGLVLGAVLMHGHNLFRVWRWRALLDPVRPAVPFRPMFVAVILGYTMTWIVPGRVGEVVRPALLSTRENLPLGPCLGSVLADRLADGTTIVVLFAVGVFLTPLTGDAAEYAAGIRTAALALVLLLAVLLALFVTANLYQSRIRGWLAPRGRVIGWIGRSMLSIAEGTEAFRRPALLLNIVCNSFAAWLVITLGTWLSIRATGVDISFGAALMMQPVLALGVALPTPGGAGGYHAAMKAGLVYLFGIAEAAAVSAGILVHLVVILPILALGVVLLWVERLSWRDLIAAAREVRNLGADREAPAAALPLEEAT